MFSQKYAKFINTIKNLILIGNPSLPSPLGGLFVVMRLFKNKHVVSICSRSQQYGHAFVDAQAWARAYFCMSSDFGIKLGLGVGWLTDYLSIFIVFYRCFAYFSIYFLLRKYSKLYGNWLKIVADDTRTYFWTSLWHDLCIKVQLLDLNASNRSKWFL